MIYQYLRNQFRRKRNLPVHSKSKRNASRLDLMIEKLEDRQMLTVSVDVVDRTLTIQGDAADNTIVVAENNKTIWVYADSLAETITYDKVKSRIRGVTINGGEGDDTVVTTSMLRSVTINGNAGNDRLFGGRADDTIDGGDGDDTIYGNGGVDMIFGRAGLDNLVGGRGNDMIEGGQDNDSINGGDGNDELFGDAGDDFILGSNGRDTIMGGVGDDRLAGNNGNDTVEGGIGDDIVTGDGNDDLLRGDEGDDRVIGGVGTDVIFGGDGVDILVGGLGNDQLNGGADNDTLLGDGGNDTLVGDTGDDLLIGGLGDDIALGEGGDDRIFTGLGDDIAHGHGGEDTILGGGGRDVLIGGYFRDVINGESGEDFIISGVINIGSGQRDYSDPLFLGVVRDAWSGDGTFDDRFSATDQSVDVGFETAEDVLIGSGGQDVFYAGGNAFVADEGFGELIFDDRYRSVDDTYNIAIGETRSISADDGVLNNDINPRGGTLVATLIADAQYGDLDFETDGSFTYTQTTRGHDSFVYEVINRFGEKSRSTVVLTSGIPELPDGAVLTALESGLEVFDFDLGTGAFPVAEDSVRVNYVGYLPNGTIFDSNDDIVFGLGNVIDGFSEGIQGMQVGGRRRIVIPSELGYGSGGNPRAGIGGDDIITFDVDLLGIE